MNGGGCGCVYARAPLCMYVCACVHAYVREYMCVHMCVLVRGTYLLVRMRRSMNIEKKCVCVFTLYVYTKTNFRSPFL